MILPKAFRLGLFLCCLSVTAFGQSSMRAELDVDAPIDTVRLYQHQAQVTRVGSLLLHPGRYALAVHGLPPAMQQETAQATVQGPASLVSMDIEASHPDAQPHALQSVQTELGHLQEELGGLEDELAVLDAQERFLEAITTQAASEATDASDPSGLRVESLRGQMQFITEEQAKLISQRRKALSSKKRITAEIERLQTLQIQLSEQHAASRTARIGLVVHDNGEVNLSLSYMVANASWTPGYTVRAVDDQNIELEYDAMVHQGSGEDWTDVRLVLSTAQPEATATPPSLSPFFLSQMEPTSLEELDQLTAAPASLKDFDPLQASGPHVQDNRPLQYDLEGSFTIPSSNVNHQRCRIKLIKTNARFVHVAVPQQSESVFIRGDFRNRSNLQLLDAEASVFLGLDYIGTTQLPAIGAGAPISVFFGPDESVRTRRFRREDKTESTGLFGGGVRTTQAYELEIFNSSHNRIEVELWDRHPISRSEQIRIDIIDLSQPLWSDTRYQEEQRPDGLLCWLVNVPPSAPLRLSYRLRVHRPKDVEVNLP